VEKRSVKLRIVKEDVWLAVMLVVVVFFVGGLMGWILHLAIMG